MGFDLYLQDILKPLDLSRGGVAPLEPLVLLELLRREVEKELGTVKSVRQYATFSGSTAMVVDYFVEYEQEGGFGNASMKLVYAEDPAEVLAEYYEWEKSRSRAKLDDHR